MSISSQGTCCLHLTDVVDKINSFSPTTWTKVSNCSIKWIPLGGAEAQIASDLKNISVNNELNIPIDSTIGFHQKCYNKFTDKTRIEAAEKRVARLQKTQQSDDNVGDSTFKVCKQKPLLRSSNTGIRFQDRRTILPEVCIICRSEKYIKEKHSGKRIRQKLSKCETNDNLLLSAAISKKDENLLLVLRCNDMVAMEVKYHRSCYKRYTKGLTKKRPDPIPGDKNQESFKEFCTEIIEKRIMEQKEILRMNKLTEIFVKKVLEKEGIDITGYRNFSLKKRIQKLYPSIHFIKRSKVTDCEIVLCEAAADNVCHLINISNSSTETDESEQSGASYLPLNHNILRDLYSSALILKSIICDHSKLPTCWPPNACDLSLDAALKIVPSELFNFLAWCSGASEDVTLECFVDVDNDIKRKILSIAQDIIYISFSGRRQTPKHLALGMTIRHLTGSSQLIGLLNGLGHCVSHSTVLLHDTALALKQLKENAVIPDGFQAEKFTTLVWDNNDFGEETLTGSGTTHNTNGIILQWEAEPKSETLSEREIQQHTKKGRKRTLDVTPPLISYFTGMKKHCPPCYNMLPEMNVHDHKAIQESPRMIDDFFYLCKFTCFPNQSIPGWTGFNTLISNTTYAAVKTTIGYLPVFDCNPTEMSTINTLLERSIKIANHLNVDNLVLVMDQAMYSKAQQIRWQNDIFQSRLVLRLGEFHTVMAYLAVIGKRFCDAGLQDILIESGIVAQNSINRVINGHHYNRSIRAHKLLAESLQTFRLQTFIQERYLEEYTVVESVMQQLNENFPNIPDLHLISSDVQTFFQKYNEFVSSKNSESATFCFWSSYLEMVEILLLFIRATREGNWKLHLSVIQSMLPWFFAYDRVNYSRYLSIYFCEMLKLNETHPNVLEEFLMGKFSVQQQSSYNFSKTPCDQVIEQTFNRDSKTKGGLIGITCNKAALHRWVLSHHSRALISRQCKIMAGKDDFTRNRKELDKSRIKQDEASIKDICDTIESMNNPFSDSIDNSELLNIVTGEVAPHDVKTDLLTAFEVGESSLKSFLNRLVDASKLDFFSPIKNLKLKTFSCVGKIVNLKVKNETFQLQSNRNLLTRLLVLAKVQNLDLADLMTYSLNPVPPALGNYDGSKTKTNKATLIHHIEEICGDSAVAVSEIASNPAIIVDGMALIQQIKHTAPTFGEFAEHLLLSLIKLAKQFNSKRIDFVTDRYPDVSIKKMEQNRRACAGIQKVKIVKASQKTPKQMKKFLALGSNKENLIEFCFQHWKTLNANSFDDFTVLVVHGFKCHRFYRNLDNELIVEEVSELQCDHEEADTRMYLHAAHASKTHESIIIKSPDTDVLLLGLAFVHNIPKDLFFVQGTSQNITILNLSQISQSLGYNICTALLGLHVFTGCDSVSSFKGKSKITAFKLMKESTSYICAFKELGTSWDVSQKLIEIMEQFVCALYGQKSCKSVDLCRYNCLKIGFKTDSTIPPNKDCIIKHIKRANYQAAIHRNSLRNFMNIPLPTNHGWKLKDGILEIDWMSGQPVPDILLMNYVHCKCKKSACATAVCSCNKFEVPCTELCACINCENSHTIDTMNSESDDEDE